MSDGGKGSAPRPFSVPKEEFDNRWDEIFGKKKKTEAEKFDQAVLKNEYYDLMDDPITGD
jgi:hypothetical protein